MPEQIFDADGAAVQYFDYDELKDKAVIRRAEDHTAILEEARRCRNEGLVNKKCEFRRIASIPYGAVMMWARLHRIADWTDVVRDTELLMKMVHDPDFSAFRTLEGTYNNGKRKS